MSDKPKIECLECIAVTGASKGFATLVSHLRAHTLSVDDYRQKYKHRFNDDPAQVPIGWSVSQASDALASAVQELTSGSNTAPNTAPPAQSSSKHHVSPDDFVTASYDTSERSYYHERYKVLYRQANEDPAVEALIRDVVVAEINVMRWQRDLATLNNGTAKQNAAGLQQAKLLANLIKDTQANNLDMLKSLNVTRAQKDQQKKTPESTPSKLCSGYHAWLSKLTPEFLSRQRDAELEATTRFQLNTQRLIDTLMEADDAVGSEKVLDDE